MAETIEIENDHLQLIAFRLQQLSVTHEKFNRTLLRINYIPIEPIIIGYSGLVNNLDKR